MTDDEEGMDRRFTILYGSQTGNAQDVAERIGRQARRRHVRASIHSMDDYDISKLIDEQLVIFVISTTGNGDFPTSSLPFWKFLLRSNLPVDILGDLTYATFGLGDSSYARYCWSSRKLNKRLRGLGAEELVEAGEADDQHYLGIEGTLRPWLDHMWQVLEDVLPPMRAGQKKIDDDQLLPPAVTVRIQDGTTSSTFSNGQASSNSNGHHVATSSSSKEVLLPKGWRWAVVRKSQRITAQDHWQDVRLVELQDRDGHSLQYEAGDVVALLPENSEADVERLLQRMGWQDVADSIIELEATQQQGRQAIPASLEESLQRSSRCTLRTLLQTKIDFNSVPRPSFFERLIPFTPQDHMQREKLEEFCTPGDGADEMYEYAIRVRRTILETLEEFDAVQIPLKYLLDVFPLIQRREFSIASGPHTDPSSVQLAIAMVSYKTRLIERRKGVCSSWIGRLLPGDQIPIRITPSSIHLPPDPTTPIIFVGPGTGVAPIRGFLQERYYLQSKSHSMKASDNLCFFGCRNKEKDWLFAQEWKTMSDSGCIDIHLAASRDQDKKVYVQDLIKAQGVKVWDTLANRGGYLYICGSSGKMPQAVREAVVGIAQEQGNKNEQEAEHFVSQLEVQGRWLEECWS